jgi:intracellular septation protein A
MKILFDLFPVLLFFAVFKWGESHQDSAQQWVTALFASVSAAGAITAEVAPVMLATGVAVLASCLQILALTGAPAKSRACTVGIVHHYPGVRWCHYLLS